MQRTPSPLPNEELRRRLTAIGFGQLRFARFAGLSLRHVHRIVVGEVPVPSFVHRLLLCAEAMHALSLLTQRDAERVGKRRMMGIVAATQEQITVGQPPKRKRRPPTNKRRKNWLTP